MISKPPIRPPQVLLILLLSAAAVQYFFRIEGSVSVPLRFLGGVIAISGISFLLWAVRIFNKHRTSIPYKVRPTALLTEGPFQKTRNPIYAGGLVMLVGIAMMAGTWPFFAVPVLMFLALHFVFVPWEEKAMEEIFKDDFLRYKSRVRRWV